MALGLPHGGDQSECRRGLRSRGMTACQDAATAVEFAIAVPVFLLLVLGIFDMGRMMWVQNTITHAAQKGARYAVVRGSESDTPTSETDVAAEVRSHIIGLEASVATVSVNWIPDNQPGSSVIVEVGYPFDFEALHYLGLSSVTLDGSASMLIHR